jgi:hypothetical protein
MSEKEEAKPAKAYELMRKLLQGEAKPEGSRK